MQTTDIEAVVDQAMAELRTPVDDEAALREQYVRIGNAAETEGPSIVRSLTAEGHPYFSVDLDELVFVQQLIENTIEQDPNLRFLDRWVYTKLDSAAEAGAYRAAFLEVTSTWAQEGNDMSLSDETNKHTLAHAIATHAGFEVQHSVGWERFRTDGEVIARTARVNIYKTTDADSGLEIVAKPKDIASGLKTTTLATALFQELTHAYGVPTVPEVSVLPSQNVYTEVAIDWLAESIGGNMPLLNISTLIKEAYGRFEENARAVRIAAYVPAQTIAHNLEATRPELSADDRAILEKWFPSDLFDDFYTVRRRVQGETYSTETEYGVRLNIEKFEQWYSTADEAAQKLARNSLQAIHRLVSDGVLLDFYGGQNFAFHNNEFVLTDVEPLQISRVSQLKPEVYSVSEDVLNGLFGAVDLPRISYDSIVEQTYGLGKRVTIQSEFSPMATNGYHSTMASNVTPAEELAHYQSLMRKTQALENPRNLSGAIPEPLVQQHYEFVALAMNAGTK